MSNLEQPEMHTVSGSCLFCHNPWTLTVPLRNYQLWAAGELIQKALPMLSADDRELLISGTCPECWERYV